MEDAKCMNGDCNILNKNICCCDCLEIRKCEFVCPAYKFECEKDIMKKQNSIIKIKVLKEVIR